MCPSSFLLPTYRKISVVEVFLNKVKEKKTLAQCKKEFSNHESCPNVSPAASGNNEFPITGSTQLEAGWPLA